MSVRMASTCLPSTKARYSAAVRAKRGVSSRCVEESLARLRNNAVRSSAPPCSRLRRKNSALSCGTPIPAKTMTKSSAPSAPSVPSAARPGAGRSRAWLAISTASRSCGSPPPLKMGSFWPRTRLFIRSSVLTPVSMKSRGPARATGLMGRPSMRWRCFAAIGGPPSMTWPTPLKTRPSMPGARPKVSGSPKKRTTVPGSVRPDVDSSTSIVISSSSRAATRPSRA